MRYAYILTDCLLETVAIEFLLQSVPFIHEFVPEQSHELNDDAVGPAEPGLDVVLAAAAGRAGVVDVVLKDFY